MMNPSYQHLLHTGCASKTLTVLFTELNMSLFIVIMGDNECNETWRCLHQVSSFKSKHPLYFAYFWISLDFNVENCLHLKYSCELGTPFSVHTKNLACKYFTKLCYRYTVIEENLH